MAGRVRDGRAGGPQSGTSTSTGTAPAIAVEPARDEPEGAEDSPGIRRLYTSALMAEVLAVPPAAVRHWVRGGLLRPVRRAGSLEWFDFQQLVAGRRLARLLGTGLSLREIDARLAGFTAGDLPAAADLTDRIVTDGRRLSLRTGDRLLGAGGQMQLPFYGGWLDDADQTRSTTAECLALTDRTDDRRQDDDLDGGSDEVVRELLDLADDLEAAGEFVEAADALRAVLQVLGPSVPVLFMLAELLYRAGDLSAARERYYAVTEIDADHLRARTSLGCVLAELGDHELALAALEGVLRHEPAYADAHWHLAGVLRDIGRRREARHHLSRFLDLAPESPWAMLAREQLAADR